MMSRSYLFLSLVLYCRVGKELGLDSLSLEAFSTSFLLVDTRMLGLAGLVLQVA